MDLRSGSSSDGTRDPRLSGGPEQEVRFGPVPIRFDATVLTPRIWTSAQSRWAAELSSRAEPGPLLELYCGAGQIGLAASNLSGRPLVQIDADPNACRWARRNATTLGVEADIRCIPIDASLRLGREFPLALADPPYLSASIRREAGDPAHAVDGGTDGLRHITACLTASARHLLPGAPLLLQVRGLGQSVEVEGILPNAAPSLVLEEVRSFGLDRAIVLLRADPQRRTAQRPTR